MISPYRGLIHYSLCGLMISAPAYFERSETNPSVSAYAEPTPLQGRLNGLCGKSKFIRQLQIALYKSSRNRKKFLPFLFIHILLSSELFR